jgi:hypothetical protein
LAFPDLPSNDDPVWDVVVDGVKLPMEEGANFLEFLNSVGIDTRINNMEWLKKELQNAIYDPDPQFENESRDKEGRYIELYVEDYDGPRSLLSDKKTDIEKLAEELDLGEYAMDWQIDFYAEYYPYTGNVAFKADIGVYGEDSVRKYQEFVSHLDRVGEGGYIGLTGDEKAVLKTVAEDYCSREGLTTSFFDIDKEEHEER